MTRPPVSRGRTSTARRWMVLLLGIGAIWRGWAYSAAHGAGGPNPRSGVIETFDVSQALLGVAWILVGLLCVWSAIIARWLWAIAAVGGMWVIWGLGYAWAWAMGSGTGSDWISTGTYLLTGLALWTVTRQPDLPVHREED